MKSKLHIVAFDIPSPPNYGGVIDVFYKIKALSELGVEIKLHVFQYGGREVSDELKDLCAGGVEVYRRKRVPSALMSRLPFIVESRLAPELLRNLNADDAPILFEGLHCCGYLGHSDIDNDRCFVRAHNIEHQYYDNLARSEDKAWKKLFFMSESKKLKRFEKELVHASRIFPLSNLDQDYFEGLFKHSTIAYPFHGHTYQEVFDPSDYVIYHGKLSVAENEEAVLFLLDKVVPHLSHELLIAGQEASPVLAKRIENTSGARLVANPSEADMKSLMDAAAAHILPGFRVSGVKLKLLAALYSGRPVFTTPEMVEGTGLEETCVVLDTAEAWQKAAKNVLTVEVDHQKRKELLAPYSNVRNAQIIWSAINA